MELLPAELRAHLPALYAQTHDRDPVVYAKFFTPWTHRTWYVTEGSPEEEFYRAQREVLARRPNPRHSTARLLWSKIRVLRPAISKTGSGDGWRRVRA